MADRIHGTCRRARSPVKAKGRQRAAVARLRPARGSLSGPHFACGAGAPPEVPGGRHHVRISRLGRRRLDGRIHLFRMDGRRSTRFQLLAQVLAWSRVEQRRPLELAPGYRAQPGRIPSRRRWCPATNRQSREPIFIMHPLNWLMCGPFPGARIAIRAAKAGRPGPFAESGGAVSHHSHAVLKLMVRALASLEDAYAAPPATTTSITRSKPPQRPSHPLQRDAFLKALAVELERHPVVGPGLVHAAWLQKLQEDPSAWWRTSETLLAPAQRSAPDGAAGLGPGSPSPPAGHVLQLSLPETFGFVQCSPRSTTIGERNMTTVFIEARPKAGGKGPLSWTMSSRNKGIACSRLTIQDPGRGHHLGEE